MRGPTAWSRDRIAAHARAGSGPPAVVIGVSFVNGLAAIRSLGRLGAPVFAVDHRRSALGFRSRYAFPLQCPDPGTDEDGFVEVLRELGDTIGRPVPVFPTHDPSLNAIARNREALGDRLLCPFPGPETVALVQSKRVQLERAVEAGVGVPQTEHPRSVEEGAAAGERLGFPVLVKPSDPDGFKRRFGRQAFRCTGPDELARAYADAEPFAPMVQELVPGGDNALYSVGSYLARDGTVLGLFCGRKLRQTPPGIGTCRVGEALWVDEVVGAALRLLRAFGFHGLSQVEFKLDPRDGRYKLMEINPRLWQWHGLAAACGVDFPRIAYRDLLGQREPAATTESCRRRWAVTLLRGESPAFQRPPYTEAVLALDDPKPALAFLARIARGVLR